MKKLTILIALAIQPMMAISSPDANGTKGWFSSLTSWKGMSTKQKSLAAGGIALIALAAWYRNDIWNWFQKTTPQEAAERTEQNDLEELLEQEPSITERLDQVFKTWLTENSATIDQDQIRYAILLIGRWAHKVPEHIDAHFFPTKEALITETAFITNKINAAIKHTTTSSGYYFISPETQLAYIITYNEDKKQIELEVHGINNERHELIFLINPKERDNWVSPLTK